MDVTPGSSTHVVWALVLLLLGLGLVFLGVLGARNRLVSGGPPPGSGP